MKPLAGLLSDLYRIKTTLTVTVEWRPSAQDSARRKIQSARRYYFSKRYTWFAHLQQKESTDAALSDDAADTEAERLGDALVELQSDGVAYGDIALTLSLHGDLADTERLDGEIRRIFNAHDAKIIREGYGQLPVWFARLPGPKPQPNKSAPSLEAPASRPAWLLSSDRRRPRTTANTSTNLRSPPSRLAGIRHATTIFLTET